MMVSWLFFGILQCWCSVVLVEKKWTARIFSHTATAEKYCSVFRRIQSNTAEITAEKITPNSQILSVLSISKAEILKIYR